MACQKVVCQYKSFVNSNCSALDLCWSLEWDGGGGLGNGEETHFSWTPCSLLRPHSGLLRPATTKKNSWLLRKLWILCVLGALCKNYKRKWNNGIGGKENDLPLPKTNKWILSALSFLLKNLPFKIRPQRKVNYIMKMWLCRAAVQPSTTHTSTAAVIITPLIMMMSRMISHSYTHTHR